jgi:transcription elongation factor GreA
MTATITAESRTNTLIARLEELRAERDRALAELTPSDSGDAADRATNVDVQVRLDMLEERIVTIETDLAAGPAARPGDGSAAEGDVVTIDLGDGPEVFLLGSINQSGEGLAVITPGSPLGQALLGASVGSSVRYVTGSRQQLLATLLAVD